MASPEERIQLQNLTDLMASDLATQDTETLVAGVRDAEQQADRAIDWSGQIVAELKRRHSWSELVALTGLTQTTLFNRAAPFRREGDPQ